MLLRDAVLDAGHGEPQGSLAQGSQDCWREILQVPHQGGCDLQRPHGDRTESGEQRREILDPTAFGGLLNPWISGSGFHAEGCGWTISSTENCEVMKTQPDTTTKTRDDLEECDKRGHTSWASAPPGFVQVSGFPGAHLQFLRCQGRGSSLSRHPLGPWAALPEPLGHAQSLLPAQVPHCRGAQGANKSVWEAAGRGKERLPVREWLHQTFPPFPEGALFQARFPWLLLAQRAEKLWKHCWPSAGAGTAGKSSPRK